MQEITNINNEIIQLFEQRITLSYQIVKGYLLVTDNYNDDEIYQIKISSLNKSFDFIEDSLQKPMNRFTAIYSIINLHKTQPTTSDLIFPFFILRESVLSKINQLYSETFKIAYGLEFSGLDPNNEILFMEDFS